MPTQIEASYEMIGRVLAKLADGGLRRVSLDASEFEVDGDEGELFGDVVAFLKGEALIAFDSQTMDYSTHQTQLTSRGIAALEDKRFDNGKSVRATLDSEEGSVSGETYSKAGSFIGGLLGGFTTSLT